MIKSAKHDFLIFAFLQQVKNRVPLQTTPLLTLIVLTHYHYHEVGFLAIKIWKIEAEVAAREFSFMELVVKDRLFTKAGGEHGCDLGDMCSLLSSKRERDAKALGSGASIDSLLLMDALFAESHLRNLLHLVYFNIDGLVV